MTKDNNSSKTTNAKSSFTHTNSSTHHTHGTSFGLFSTDLWTLHQQPCREV